MFKKSLSHLLLVAFLMQLFGMTVIYFSQRYALNKAAIKIIELNNESQFTYLKLTALEFQLAIFEEQELFINGQLFDIVDKKIEKENVIVKVYRDTNEESFLKKSIDWLDVANPNKSCLPKLIFKTFFNPSFIDNNEHISFFKTTLVKYNSFFWVCLLNVFIPLDTPPPLV